MNSRPAKISSMSPVLSSAFDAFAANSHRSAFVRDLPFCCSAEKLRTLLQREVGIDLEEIMICRNSEGKTLQYGCVMFQNEEDADKTIARLHGYRFFGRDIRIIKYNKDAIMETSSTGAVLVSFKGVNQDLELVTEATIRAAFEQFGEISHVSIRSHLYNSYGIQGGFGFLGFVDSSLNNRVVAEINQTIINGVQYDCNWSKHINKGSQGSDGVSSNTDGSSFFKRKHGTKDSFVRSSQASENSPAGHDTNARTAAFDTQHSIQSPSQPHQHHQQLQSSPTYVFSGGRAHAANYPTYSSSPNVQANMMPYAMYSPVAGALPSSTMGMIFAGGQPTSYYGPPMAMPMNMGMMPAFTTMRGPEFAPQSPSFAPMQGQVAGTMMQVSPQTVNVPVQQQAVVSRNHNSENSQSRQQQQQIQQHLSQGKTTIYRNQGSSMSPSLGIHSSPHSDPISSSNIPSPQQHQIHSPTFATHNSNFSSASSSSSPIQNSSNRSDPHQGNKSGSYVPQQQQQQQQQQLGAQSHHPVLSTHSFSPATGPMPAPRPMMHMASAHPPSGQQTAHQQVPNANNGYLTGHPIVYTAAQPVFPPPPMLQPMHGQSHTVPQVMASPVLTSMSASFRSIPPSAPGMNLMTNSPTLSTPPPPTLQTAAVRGQDPHPTQQLQPPGSQQPLQQHQASPNAGVPMLGSYISAPVGYPSSGNPPPSSSAMYSYQTVPVVPPPLANMPPVASYAPAAHASSMSESYMMVDGNSYVYSNAGPQHVVQHHQTAPHSQQQQSQQLPVNMAPVTTVAGQNRPSSFQYAPSMQPNPGSMQPGIFPGSFSHNSPAQFNTAGSMQASQHLQQQQLVHGHQHFLQQYGQPYAQQHGQQHGQQPAPSTYAPSTTSALHSSQQQHNSARR